MINYWKNNLIEKTLRNFSNLKLVETIDEDK